jgi:hypothetical protein
MTLCDCGHSNRYDCPEREFELCECLCHRVQALEAQLEALRRVVNRLADEEDDY